MTRALVGYAARRTLGAVRASAGMRYRSNPYITAARMAYTYRKPIYRGAKRVGRALYRAAKKRKYRVSNVGQRIGTATAKTYETQYGQVNSPTRELNAYDMCFLPKTSSQNDANNRQRGLVNMRGFKVCMEIVNKSAVPMYLNLAVISPTGKNNGFTVNNAGQDSEAIFAKFFRDQGTSNDRYKNFSSALSALELRCLPINTDEWTVLKHKRMLLGRVPEELPGTGTLFTQRANFKTFEFYKRISRQIMYDSGSGTSAEQPVYLVWWADQWGTPGGGAQQDIIDYNLRVIKYFKEPKN